MNPFATWLAVLFLLVVTIRYLPFISAEAALRFQFWFREIQRRIEQAIEDSRRP